MEKLNQLLLELAATAGGRLLYALLMLIVGMFAIRLFLKALRKGKLFHHLEATVQTVLFSGIQILLYVLLSITVISILGVPMTSVVTVLASAGLTVSLALQGTLGNLAGGIMLILFHPYHVGDYVEICGVSGTVCDVSLFYTSLKTPANQAIVVPNGSIMNATVVNYNAYDQRRADYPFTLRSSSDVAAAREALLAMTKKDERILQNPAPVLYVMEYREGMIRCELRVWYPTSVYWDVYFVTGEAVGQTLAEAGISFARPQCEVHLDHGSSDFT